MKLDLQQAVEQAREGDKAALEYLVKHIQDKIYGLALRMLWHPEDAQDATQEILIRVITRLGSFRGESAFTTWVYRVAANYLLNARKSRLEKQAYSFERFGEELERHLSDGDSQLDNHPEKKLLLEEVKIGCTLGMLLCLDRPHRLAYILGEIFGLPGKEAAAILEISPSAFRKRLSRARSEVLAFTRQKCGLVHPENTCRCHRRLKYALTSGRVDPDNLLFAADRRHARQFPAVLKRIRKLEEARRTVALYRSHPDFALPESFVEVIKNLIKKESF